MLMTRKIYPAKVKNIDYWGINCNVYILFFEVYIFFLSALGGAVLCIPLFYYGVTTVKPAAKQRFTNFSPCFLHLQKNLWRSSPSIFMPKIARR